MSLYSVFLYIVFGIIVTLATERFMGVFFEKRRTSLSLMTFSYIFYLVVITVIDLLPDLLPDHMTLSNQLIWGYIPLIFIVSLNYESSIIKRLIATVSFFVLFIIVILITFSLADLLPASFLANENGNDIWKEIAFSLLLYLVAQLLRRFKNVRKRDISMPLFWVFTFVVQGVTILIIIFFLLNPEPSPAFIVFPLIAFFFGANILVFYMLNTLSATYEDKVKFTLHSQEKEYFLSQCQLMQESMEKMKSYSRDMKKYLTTVKDHTKDNKEATNYLDSLLGSLKDSDVYSDTGNIAIDSIINFKLKNAKKDNIKPEIKIFVPSALNIETADIGSIIGNLLDNALNAVAKVEEKIIKLNINFSQGKLFIKVENTFDGRVTYMEEKAGREKRIATLEDDDEYGYALKNIRESVETYNGCIDIVCTDNIFSVELIL